MTTSTKNRIRFAALVSLLAAMGCTSTRPVPPISLEHPGHFQAPEAPIPRVSIDERLLDDIAGSKAGGKQESSGRINKHGDMKCGGM